MTSWQSTLKNTQLYRSAERKAQLMVSSLMLLTIAVVLLYPKAQVAIPLVRFANPIVFETVVQVREEPIPEPPRLEKHLAEESPETVVIPPPPPEPVPPPIVKEALPPLPPVVKSKPKRVVPKLVKEVPKVVEETPPVLPAEPGEGSPEGVVKEAEPVGHPQGVRSGGSQKVGDDSLELSRLVAVVEAHKVYPRRARQNGESGRLALSVRLDANGTVSAVDIHTSHPSRLLQQAALKAAAPLVGMTTKLGGPREVVIPIVFSLTD